MGYDWSESAEGGGSGDKMEPGIYKVTGNAVIRGSKKGDFKSKKGDAQIMLVVENEDGAEAATMFTLSEKAAWTLARWLARCGVDLKAMQAEGIEPTHFGNTDIAEKYLVGASCWCRVELGTDPKYRDLTPIKEEEARAEAPHLFGPVLAAKKKPADHNDPLNRHGPNCAHTISESQCDMLECCGSPF